MWRSLMALLASLSAEPQAVDHEHPRAAAAVAAAYATFAVDAAPAPTPAPGKCCGECKGGWITHGDGHRTPCPCPASCKCKAAGCPSGDCVPKASPATAVPAMPAGRG